MRWRLAFFFCPVTSFFSCRSTFLAVVYAGDCLPGWSLLWILKVGRNRKDTEHALFLPFMQLKGLRAHEDCGPQGTQPSLYCVPDRQLASRVCPVGLTDGQCFLIASFFFYLPQDRVLPRDCICMMNLWKSHPCQFCAEHSEGSMEESHPTTLSCTQLPGMTCCMIRGGKGSAVAEKLVLNVSREGKALAEAAFDLKASLRR